MEDPPSSLKGKKRMWLKQEIVNLLKQHPQGIEKVHFWDFINHNIKGIGPKNKYGVKSMNELFEYYDNLEIVSTNNISYVKLKAENEMKAVNKPSIEELKKVICEVLDENRGRVKRDQFWNKVAEKQRHFVNPSSYGFSNLYEFLKHFSDIVVEVSDKNELYIQKKTSSDFNEPSIDRNSSYLGENMYHFPSLNETIRSNPSKPSLAEVRHRFCDVLLNFPQGMPLPKLLDNYERMYHKSKFNLLDYNVSNFEELFKLPEFRCFSVLVQNNMIMIYLKEHNTPSHNMFYPSNVNQMSAPKWGEPAFPAMQQQPHVTDSFHLAPFSKLPPPKTNEKEILVPPLNIAPGETLTKERLDKIAKECIEILSDNNECVSIQAIENLFLQRLRRKNLRELGIRTLDHLPSVHDHNRLVCKVNAYIQAFVTVRSVCTLKELEECIALYVNESNSFQSLKLGPLHKMQIVFDLFKFPPGEDSFPELSTMDVLDNIRNFLNENNWYKKHEMQEVMTFLTKAFHCSDPFHLGIRLRSLPLAIGVIKRAQKDDSTLTRKVFDDMKMKLTEEIQNAFNKFRGYILVTKQNDTHLKEHYAKMSADAALKEIFERLCLLLQIDEPKTIAEQKQKRRFIEISNSFFQQISNHDLARTVFHVAICVSSTELQATALEFLDRSPQPAPNDTNRNERPPPSKEQVLQSLKKYLEKYISSGTLNLNHFNKIEERLLEDFGMTTFSQMGYGRFLSFLQNNTLIKKILDETGLTMSGTSESNKSGIGVYKPSPADVCNFVIQCKDACTTIQNNLIENALCHHYAVKNLKSIGHGTVQHIVDLACKRTYPASHVFYEAALCSLERSMNCTLGKVGILGYQNQETVLATLHNCPLLEDMSAWSHWPLVFEPQFGKLLDFVLKNGGEKYVQLEGGRKSVRTDFMVLETEPGKYLKIISETSVEKFSAACSTSDVINTCGHLVSLIVHNKGLAMTPFAYLSNILQTQLFTLNNDTNSKQDDEKYTGNPAKFVLDCLLRLPIQICVSVANKMFLEPLGKVLGLTESKLVLWKNCQNIQETNRLETLGCLLGIADWVGTLNKMKGSFITSEIETIAEMEDDQQTDKESEEELIESDSEDSIKSSDEDDIITMPNMVLETQSTEELDNVLPEIMPNKNSDVIIIDEENEETGTNDANKQDESLPEEEKEEICSEKALIETIRREEFGLGIKLNADGQKLIDRQQERLGRSLDRLSKDLYSKDTHFVLELIQNADDNTYPDNFDSKDSSACPSVQFGIDDSSVTILNNEVGFKEKNIRAICDVGKSTKEKRKFGYIGQKGIGFKSVFRITDRPEIHSNKYHICFDVNSGPTGYILPHWIDSYSHPEDNWVTKILLPLKDGVQQSKCLAASFNDIHPSLLLFLHRLKKITLRNEIQGTETVMQRYDQEHDIVEITHNGVVDRWFVIKKLLDATKVSAQVKSDIDVESTEIALAFPMKLNKSFNAQVLPEKQPVFAFLPLRSYGLRFIIQGDFDLPSNREAVDSDSLWNQWLSSEIPSLFLDALEKFKAHPHFTSPVMAVASYLQFVPEEDEVLDFFRPIATHIQKKLKSKPCIPCQPLTEGGNIQWKIPSQTLLGQDSLTMKVAPPQKLQEILNLCYLHPDLANILNISTTNSLGIEKIKTAHLLKIGEGLASDFYNSTTVNSEQIAQIARWFACVYRSLDEMGNNEDIFAKLSEIRIIPLSSSILTTLRSETVFLPMDSYKHPVQKRNDKFLPLWNDLRTVHSELFCTDDPEINIQVHKLILQMGVQPLQSDNIINHHILPILQSEDWKLKSESVLVNYVMFMKYQYDRDPNSFVFSGLSSVVPLKTNKGMLCPDQVAIHFTPSYGNKINLSKELPGYDWVLLTDVYLQGATQKSEKLSWHEFFGKLKVTDLLSITETTIKINQDNKDQLPWKPLYETWPANSGDYVVADFACQEFESLVNQNRNMETFSKQMDVLCQIIDGLWDAEYSKYITTTLESSDGHILKEIPTSFAINLQTLPWLPAEELKLENNNGTVKVSKKSSEQVSDSLYLNSDNLKYLLGHAVSYSRIKLICASFCKFLGIKTSTNPQHISDILIKWGERTNDSDKVEFCGSLKHMNSIYTYLSKHLTNDEVKNIFKHKPVIFVPSSNSNLKCDYVVGQMYKREEIWWNDSTGLIEKHMDLLKSYKKNCSLKSGIQNFYQNLEEFFCDTVRISRYPLLQDYGELIQVLSYLDEDGLQNMKELFFLIGEKIQICNMSKKQDLFEMIEQQKRKLFEILQGENIFPTVKNKLVSLQDFPVIADNKVYEKMFKDELNFIDLEYETVNKKKRKITAEKRKYIQHFLDLFKIGFLSNCIKEDVKTELYKPCYKLQDYMHQIIYPIQCYLYNTFPEIYEKWKQLSFHDAVGQWKFSQVKELEVWYTFTRNTDIYVIQNETCIIKDNTFYVQENHLNSKYLNSHIALYFSSNDHMCYLSLKEFLSNVGDKLDSPPELESFLSTTSDIPSDEIPWVIPAPPAWYFQAVSPAESIDPVIQPVNPMDECQASVKGNMEPDHKANTSSGMVSWPPASSAVMKENLEPKKSGGHGGACSWPLPEAPGYYKSGPSTKFKISAHADEQQDKTEKPQQQTEESVEQTKKPGKHVSSGQDKNISLHASTDEQRVQGEKSNQPAFKTTTAVDRGASSTQGQNMESNRRLEKHMSSSSLENSETNNSETVNQRTPLRRKRSNEDLEEPKAKRYPQPNFDFPIWLEGCKDLEYKELARGKELNIPEQYNIDPDSTDCNVMTARWGEHLVFNYLLQQKTVAESFIYSISWMNEIQETGQPYDIKVVLKKTDENGSQRFHEEYIEVKSTLSEKKSIFEISNKELEFANQKLASYHVYRVFNAGNSSNVRLLKIENLALYIKQKKIHLCLII
ncbi:Hypothetical predicted protein [Octopus vulgaris]|nr:Hypothetical predicted protein [Octopus vulgaris]